MATENICTKIDRYIDRYLMFYYQSTAKKGHIRAKHRMYSCHKYNSECD